MKGWKWSWVFSDSIQKIILHVHTLLHQPSKFHISKTPLAQNIRMSSVRQCFLRFLSFCLNKSKKIAEIIFYFHFISRRSDTFQNRALFKYANLSFNLRFQSTNNRVLKWKPSIAARLELSSQLWKHLSSSTRPQIASRVSGLSKFVWKLVVFVALEYSPSIFDTRERSSGKVIRWKMLFRAISTRSWTDRRQGRQTELEYTRYRLDTIQ